MFIMDLAGHMTKKQGVWSEGPISTLLFSIDKNYEDLKLEIICRPYLTKKNKFLEFDIYAVSYTHLRAHET